MSNSAETTQTATASQPPSEPSKPFTKFPTEQAARANQDFELIKEALIGPKPPDEKGSKTWVLPKQDPKTGFSTP